MSKCKHRRRSFTGEVVVHFSATGERKKSWLVYKCCDCKKAIRKAVK